MSKVYMVNSVSTRTGNVTDTGRAHKNIVDALDELDRLKEMMKTTKNPIFEWRLYSMEEIDAPERLPRPKFKLGDTVQSIIGDKAVIEDISVTPGEVTYGIRYLVNDRYFPLREDMVVGLRSED